VLIAREVALDEPQEPVRTQRNSTNVGTSSISTPATLALGFRTRGSLLSRRQTASQAVRYSISPLSGAAEALWRLTAEYGGTMILKRFNIRTWDGFEFRENAVSRSYPLRCNRSAHTGGAPTHGASVPLRGLAQLNDLVPIPADRAPLLFSVHVMLVAGMLLIGGVLIAAAIANCAYFYLRARRGAVPQPVRANQGL
jgi:hypothetical protein